MNQVSIGSDDGLSPILRQAIIWTSAGLLSIGPLGTNLSEILTKMQNLSFRKMHLKTSSAKRRPFCPGGDVFVLWFIRRYLHERTIRQRIGDFLSSLTQCLFNKLRKSCVKLFMWSTTFVFISYSHTTFFAIYALISMVGFSLDIAVEKQMLLLKVLTKKSLN